jgi:hypothetical protein
MQFHLSTAEIFVPDGLPIKQALRRTTHMASAYQDDIEIMAARSGMLPKWGKMVYRGSASDGRVRRVSLYKEYADVPCGECV